MSSAWAPPPIAFQGRSWTSEDIAAIARAWRAALAPPIADAPEPIAMVMANHPEAIALFFALSAGRAPVVLLPPDPRSWRTAPAIPPGTRLVLPPALAPLAAAAESIGMRPAILSTSDHLRGDADLAFLTCPGLVFFTSGSTGLPRPVYRTAASLIRAATALARASEFPSRGGVIAALPLDRSYGMNTCLMTATVLGRPLGLLERFDHHALLALFASRDYHLWAGTPVMADALGRSSVAAGHAAPAICIFAGRLPAPVCRAFEARFGVSLRQLYGTTETLSVSVDVGRDPVRAETAGRPLPGVGVRIGDHPHAAALAGAAGSIWVSSPWAMEGYGFPPEVAAEGIVDRWWRSPDVGHVDADGYLTISGRLDDCIRTGSGHLVDPAAIAAVLEGYPGVAESAVVPVEAAAGPVLGVLVQTRQPVPSRDLHDHLASRLPAWTRPRVIETVRDLPRLASGRVDRRACIAILEQAVRTSASGPVSAGPA